MTELPEEHYQGILSIENLRVIQEMDLQNCDFGLQIAWDGRVWVCVNGVAFLRFKPETRERVEKQVAEDQHILKRLE